MKQLILFLFMLVALRAAGQERVYSTNENAHAHNDYNNVLPFYTAYSHRFASIEVDVCLVDGELLVAHAPGEVRRERTLERLYLRPLAEKIEDNGGAPYAGDGKLQLLVDIKSESEPTMRALERLLQSFRHCFDPSVNPRAARVVITGNAPAPGDFDDYDALFLFDGNPYTRYTPAQASRVAMYSLPLARFSAWNGLGRIPEPELRAITALVDSLHRAGKKIRFWGNADTKTLWQAFIKIGVDYINTDRPEALAGFLRDRVRHSYRAGEKYVPREPGYRVDGKEKAPRNVILLISDGAGLHHLWAAATANGGDLNVMKFKHAGLLQTAPFDDYNTDSAAAGTAIATGTKTRNRYIGVAPDGRRLASIAEILAARGIAAGIITNDNLTGATPAAFYAHVRERNESDSIASDLARSTLSLAVGGEPHAFSRGDTLLASRAGFRVIRGAGHLDGIAPGERVICLDRDSRDHRVIERAFDASVRRLSSRGGFFLMVEGARIDAGGHANDLSLCIEEYLSFDRVVGKALEFADTDGQTLVIVTSDHETGGLVPLDGDYAAGYLLADFATVDHTGAPVPLFAYGPGARAFTGFLQNSDLLDRISSVLHPGKSTRR
ncbi:MAG: alkaline phosphatase [Odoribacteraceae bacterium]|jgi:alkaline phosphatase|nr:alkaline phosphatase [Odoribacteraceae bacterium]